MIKNKRRLLISWAMALVMLLNVVLPCNIAYAASVENTLTNLAATISQNGTEISEGGTLTSSDPMSVEVTFSVPVEGDEPTPDNPVRKGDTATFALSSAFKIISADSIPLKMGSLTVGHASFSTDSATNMVSANVVFDGDDAVFDGTYNTVGCKFNANFEYDASGDAGASGDHLVTILEKTYTVNVPALPIQYEVTKSGTPDLATQSIEWTVGVSATQAGAGIDLSGYQFSDDLGTVGTYITDSFTVGGVSATPAEDGSKLSYTFSPGSTSPQTITFRTEIPDEKYYGAGEQRISNKAQLLDGESNIMNEGSTQVSFTPKWIEKKGTSSDSGSSGTYDPQNRTITWTITANQMGASLNNVVITDLLPTGLTLKSAIVQPWNAGSSDWDPATHTWTEAPADGKYSIGDISSQILLTLVTAVPDEMYTTGVTTYKNSASIQWDGLSGTGIGSGSVNVGVGYNAITKSGMADTAARSVHWTVNVDTKGQSIPNLKVYDLLVYGSSSSGFSLSQATGFPTGMTPTDLMPRYDQKYIDGSLSGSGLNIVVHPIMQGGERVADLLEITGLSTTVPNSFTFDSLVVNPDVFAGNKTSQVWNTASLFSANVKLNMASNKVDYPSNMLAKELLKREAMSDPAAGVNNKTTNADEGFDYVDKSVIFRLSVNADGMDLSNRTNALGQSLGTATVTDTLPDGWVFTEIAPGKDYLIFAGNTGSNKSVTASSTTPLDTVAGLSADFTTAGIANFTFSDLDAPYVILVKAKPTSEAAAGYFNANKITTVRNNLALSTENWTPGVASFQDVTITSKLLEKSLTTPTAGELRWTVDYKPYDLPQTGTKLEDTLPAGIDLRTDSDGTLPLSDGNITVLEMSLNADGSYTTGDEVTLKIGENLFYDNATRILSFLIPDSAKAYRFSYLTDVTGEPGTVSNKVSLYGNSAAQEETTRPYVITAADGEATLQRNGWIVITKIDGTGSPLAGAEFTLFAADGTTVIRKNVTGSDGTVKFKVIPDGEYVLRETAAPAGYILDSRTHSLTVTTTDSMVLASIDGKTGTGANAITIQNYREGTVGNLAISKTVAGNAADETKQFDLTVTFSGASSTYSYIGNGIPDGTIRSGDTISLAHGQGITITGLPKDTAYSVTEADYSASGYSKASTGETGTIAADATQTASFTNTRNVSHSDPAVRTGTLTISKTVTGTGADTTKEFRFTITLDGASGSYPYTGKGVQAGTIQSGDTFSLSNGQSITITGLPAGANYEVAEDETSAQGYSVESAGSSGTISSTQDRTAAFTNTKLPNSTGSLSIRKTVTGQGADLNKKFDFTVTLTNAPDAYPYTGNSSGTLRSGDTLSLANGEEVTITGLPEGTAYTVTEADYSGDGYTTSSTGSAGVISANTVQAALFTNAWSGTSGTPGNPQNPSGNIDDGNTPQGSMDGGETANPELGENIGDGTTPQGSMNGGNTAMPKTGDPQTGSFAKLGLLFFSTALAALSTADYILRKKYSGKRIRK